MGDALEQHGHGHQHHHAARQRAQCQRAAHAAAGAAGGGAALLRQRGRLELAGVRGSDDCGRGGMVTQRHAEARGLHRHCHLGATRHARHSSQPLSQRSQHHMLLALAYAGGIKIKGEQGDGVVVVCVHELMLNAPRGGRR